MKRTVAVLSLLVVCAAAPGAAAAAEPWRDPGQPPRQRADELLAALSSTRRSTSPSGTSTPVASLGVPPFASTTAQAACARRHHAAPVGADARGDLRPQARARRTGEAIAAEARGKGFNYWSGRRWTSRARRSPAASPRTWARTRCSPARRRHPGSRRRQGRPRDRDAQALRRQQPGVASASASRPCRTAPAPGDQRARRPSARSRRSTRRRSSARSARPAPTRSCAPTTGSTARGRARARRCSTT